MACLDNGGRPIEVKLTSRTARDDLASLNANADLIGADRRFLVCRRAEFVQSGNQTVCDLEGDARLPEAARPGGRGPS